MKPYINNLGGLIRDIRKSQGLKGWEIGSINPSVLSRIENNKHFPNAKQNKILADVLGIPFELMYYMTLGLDELSPDKHQIVDSTQHVIWDLFFAEYLGTSGVAK